MWAESDFCSLGAQSCNLLAVSLSLDAHEVTASFFCITSTTDNPRRKHTVGVSNESQVTLCVTLAC